MSSMLRATMLVDSNVYRHTTADRMSSKSGCPLTMINVTKMATLEIGLETARKDESGLVLLSVFSNLISDAGKLVKEAELESCVTNTIRDLVVLLTSKLVSKKRVLVLVPFYRDEPKWFGAFLRDEDRLAATSGGSSNSVPVGVSRGRGRGVKRSFEGRGRGGGVSKRGK